MSGSSLNKCLLRQTRSLFLTCRIIGTKGKYTLVRNQSQVAEYDEETDPTRPIRFSTSKAAEWKSKYQNLSKETVDPKQQKEQFFRWLSFTCSYAVLLVYIFIRDGNDWDDEMAMPLGKRMLQLQEWQLLGEKAENIRNREDVSEIDAQLRKITKLRKQYKYD